MHEFAEHSHLSIEHMSTRNISIKLIILVRTPQKQLWIDVTTN